MKQEDKQLLFIIAILFFISLFLSLIFGMLKLFFIFLKGFGIAILFAFSLFTLIKLSEYLFPENNRGKRK